MLVTLILQFSVLLLTLARSFVLVRVLVPAALERQGGPIAGFCAIAIEENEKTKKLCVAYPNATAVVQGSSWYQQCNDQKLKSFENYYPEIAFEKYSF